MAVASQSRHVRAESIALNRIKALTVNHFASLGRSLRLSRRAGSCPSLPFPVFAPRVVVKMNRSARLEYSSHTYTFRKVSKATPMRHNSALRIRRWKYTLARMSRRVRRTIVRVYFPFLSVTAVALSISPRLRALYWDGISLEIHTCGGSSENPRCLVFLARFFVAAAAAQFHPNKIGTLAEIEISFADCCLRRQLYLEKYVIEIEIWGKVYYRTGIYLLLKISFNILARALANSFT